MEICHFAEIILELLQVYHNCPACLQNLHHSKRRIIRLTQTHTFAFIIIIIMFFRKGAPCIFVCKLGLGCTKHQIQRFLHFYKIGFRFWYQRGCFIWTKPRNIFYLISLVCHSISSHLYFCRSLLADVSNCIGYA